MNATTRYNINQSTRVATHDLNNCACVIATCSVFSDEKYTYFTSEKHTSVYMVDTLK